MNMPAFVMLLSGGVFAGSVFAIAWNRLPMWRALPMAQFKADFGQTVGSADRVQPFLLVAAIAAAVWFGWHEQGTVRMLAWIAAAGFCGTLAASVAILVPLQRRILALPDETASLEAMRAKWFMGHTGRTVLSVLSFALAAAAATW